MVRRSLERMWGHCMQPANACQTSGERPPQNTHLHRHDLPVGIALSVITLALYVHTLLPGLGIGDTAELQRVAPTLAVAHPTGYPFYTLLGWLWSHLPLGSTPAWRMNLFSAVAGALTVGVLYLCARTMGQRLVVAIAAPLTLATSVTFWSQATITEVYALALLLQALLILAVLHWRNRQLPLWSIGLLCGLALAHHRSIMLILPGLLVFIALSRWPRPSEIGSVLLATFLPCLLYLYLALRAPPWEDRWLFMWRHATGTSMVAVWLDPAQLWAEGLGRPLALVQTFIWPELLPIGTLLALSGTVALAGRDRALALLLLISYAIVFLFCSVYYVIDIDAFLLPAHLLAALLLGEGLMLLLRPLPPPAARVASLLCLALPIALLSRNIDSIRAANSPTAEQAARAIMSQSLSIPAVIVDDRNSIERLRYLQAVEGQHPDLTLVSDADRKQIQEWLERDATVYLLHPAPELGLRQHPAGLLWQVQPEPLRIEQMTPITARWAEGIDLVAYTLPAGSYQPGDVVPITLAWAAQQTPSRDYTLFVHLIGPDGSLQGQHDRPPSVMPTSQWQPGQRLIDIYGPRLAPAAPPGQYQVVIGWYDYQTMERLEIEAAENIIKENTMLLEEILVLLP